MTRTLKYCSITFSPGKASDESTLAEDHISKAFYIRFPKTQAQEKWEESFQYKRANTICNRIQALPGVTEVNWEQDFISIRVGETIRHSDLLAKLTEIIRDEEKQYDKEEREQNKLEIKKLVDSVIKENYEEMKFKAEIVLDSLT